MIRKNIHRILIEQARFNLKKRPDVDIDCNYVRELFISVSDQLKDDFISDPNIDNCNGYWFKDYNELDPDDKIGESLQAFYDFKESVVGADKDGKTIYWNFHNFRWYPGTNYLTYVIYYIDRDPIIYDDFEDCYETDIMIGGNIQTMTHLLVAHINRIRKKLVDGDLCKPNYKK